MGLKVYKSLLKGTVTIPPSKSYMQRYIAAALLSKNEIIIHNPDFSNDSKAAISIAESLGASIRVKENSIIINSDFKLINKEINCHESGLSMRLFSPIISLLEQAVTLVGEGSLLTRPVSMISDALSKLNVSIKSTNNKLPLIIQGKMKSGDIVIDGSISSQLLTGLLFALPMIDGDSRIIVNDLKSKPYIDITLEVLNEFGVEIINNNYEEFIIKGNQQYKAHDVFVPSDWSSASCLIAGAAINGNIAFKGLDQDSNQADRKILEALESANVDFFWKNNELSVNNSEIRPFNFDATDCPDLFPALVLLASKNNGISKIKGVSRLIHKESNRATALQTEFAKLGIKIKLDEDNMLIYGGNIKGCKVDSHKDHRIAMALIVAGTLSDLVLEINAVHCINKSYPNFISDLKKVNAKINNE